MANNEERNIYGLSDEKINELEQFVESVEEKIENSEEFLDLVFPKLSNEDKAKIAVFAFRFTELFGGDEDLDDYDDTPSEEEEN